MKPEIELLIKAARLDGAEVLELPVDHFDPALFLDAACRHRVAALVGTRMAAAGVFTPDSKLEYVADVLQAARLLNERRNGVLLETAAEVGALLSKASIPYALRKGAYLTPVVYRDPGLRPMSDVDIFVDPAARHDVTALLEAAGFQQGSVTADGLITPPTRREAVFWAVHVNNLPTFHRVSPDPVLKLASVDICFDLFMPASGCHLPAAELLADTRTFELAGTTVASFRPEYFALDVAAHLYKESTTLRYIERGKHQRLLQYVDLLAVLSQESAFDWNLLLDAAIEAGAARNLYFALANTAELYPDTIANHALDRLEEAGDIDESFLREYGRVDLATPLTWSAWSIVERLFSDERAAVASKSPV